MKKYIVHPEFVISKNDGDRHYISFNTLCKLYGVHPHECYHAEKIGYIPESELEGLPHLYPRYGGNYKLEEVENGN